MIIRNLLIQIKNIFTKGHERSLRAKKNIALSIIIKILNKGIGILLVPIVLNYLDQTRYGIWLTMSSIVACVGFLDIGLGNGLRNKFAEAKAQGEDEKACIYVSTTYAILSIIMSVFFIIFLIANRYLPWSKILNVGQEINADLSTLALIVFGFFSLKFIVNLVTTIIVADQKPAILDAIQLSGQILILLTIYFFTKTMPSSLIYMGLAYTGLPVFVIVISSFYFYTGMYKQYRPSIKFVDFKYAKDLFSLGWKFFIIQIAVVILFTTDNIIIAQLFGPEQVTTYQIAHKYFNIPLIFFLLFSRTLWSAVTEAYSKNDFKWIKNFVKKLQKIWVFFVGGILLMLVISPFFFKIWIGDRVYIPFLLSTVWALFVILQTYNSIFTGFINGVGKLKIQLIITFFSIFANIPLSILFAKYFGLGISGVIIATSISILISTITKTIQYKKIINHTASGIWNV